MEDDEDDDIYAPDEGEPSQNHASGGKIVQPDQLEHTSNGNVPQDEESGEEIEDESDSDIDIITERKEEPKKDILQGTHVNASNRSALPLLTPIEPGLVRSGSAAVRVGTPAKETHLKAGTAYPAVRTSSVDVEAKPIHEPSGRPITEVDMDADLPGEEKAWRRPGSDMTDYFNYGFDEFTWASYCLKQQAVRKEVSDSKKQMDNMQSLLSNGIPSMPGMQGIPGAPGGGMPQMPGMPDIPPEMQQMFSQMMAQGMDPSQMDPGAFAQMMSGGQGGQGGDQGYGNQGYGQQHNSQMGYGYGSVNQGTGRGRGRRW
ncbi:uncharacterized protein KY384_007794 [Bacidia gigantensis]|uniref:uncharacterized protein n=1 Tax=Bacidia gigantensis TaxID=2732470 RepID=UPI001D05BE4E|nr:uncharacterized protein KY384_007794 [Bacidia gigantensis]KAG8527641.1 hypothetical protein KY384_007794 [Bacidia gigantensis]